jgi:hypothetical protein
MDQAVADHEQAEDHRENDRPFARVEERPSVGRDLHVGAQEKEKGDQDEAQRAPGDIEAVRNGQQDRQAQGEVAEKVGEGRTDVSVIVEDQVGVERSLRNGEGQIDRH